MPITENIENEKSARIDLFGGTLDIPPMHLILDNVVTINAAISLKSKVKISKLLNHHFENEDVIEIISHDYQTEKRIPLSEFTPDNLYKKKIFGEFNFVAQILDQFPIKDKKGVRIEFTSTIPPGSGLGGSSVMGINLFEALGKFFQIPLTKNEILLKVKNIEARILDSGPTGYQDYYPALFGGILSLHPTINDVEVEQIYSEELKNFLENHLYLVYSGKSRLSGINNWEVYKDFFDKKKETREGLQNLSLLANRAYRSIKGKKYQELLNCLIEEGLLRDQLFSGIMTPEMRELLASLQSKLSSASALKAPSVGIKVCGAGGGGCFLLVNPRIDPWSKEDQNIIKNEIHVRGMRLLNLEIEKPLS